MKRACILDSGQRLTHPQSSPSLLALCLRSRFLLFFLLHLEETFFVKKISPPFVPSKYHGPVCSSTFGSRLRMLLPQLRRIGDTLRPGPNLQRQCSTPAHISCRSCRPCTLVRARGIARV
ncbi:hypothetical protein CGRA01v4_05230 [Colletotrichum graminicola]|nr:hypothetical protein CGRA01v4_05230 [Colletotrichum graminicola]